MAKFLDDFFITGNETNVFVVNSDNVSDILLVSNTGNVAVGGNIFSGAIYSNPKLIVNTGSGIPGLMHLNSFGVELVTFTNVGDSLFGNASNHDLAFITNNIERIKVTAAGAVGINHLTPPAQLTVVGAGSTSSTHTVRIGNSSSSLLFNIRDDGFVSIGTLSQATSEKLNVNGDVFIPVDNAYYLGSSSRFIYGTNSWNQGGSPTNDHGIAMYNNAGSTYYYVNGNNNDAAHWFQSVKNGQGAIKTDAIFTNTGNFIIGQNVVPSDADSLLTIHNNQANSSIINVLSSTGANVMNALDNFNVGFGNEGNTPTAILTVAHREFPFTDPFVNITSVKGYFGAEVFNVIDYGASVGLQVNSPGGFWNLGLSQASQETRLTVVGLVADHSQAAMMVYNSLFDTPVLAVGNGRNVGVNVYADANISLQVQGLSTTSVDYALVTQDSAANLLMSIRDDGDVSIGDSTIYGGTSIYYQKGGNSYINPNAGNGITASDFILNVRNTSWGINGGSFGITSEYVRLNVSDSTSSFQLNRQEYNTYLPDTTLMVAFREGSGSYDDLENAKFVYTRNLNYNDVNDRTFRGIHIDNTLGTWTNAGSGFAKTIGLHVKDNQTAIFAEGDIIINNLAGSGNRNLEVDSTGKIVVGSSSASEGIKNVIVFGDTVNVDANYQYLIYGNLEVDGTLNNAGEVVIINGAMIMGGSGVFNNTGTLTLVDLLSTSTYSSSKAVITFTPGTVNVANTITHNTGTANISVQLWDVTTGQVILANIQNATTTTVDIVFSSNPAGQVKAMVIGF